MAQKQPLVGSREEGDKRVRKEVLNTTSGRVSVPNKKKKKKEKMGKWLRWMAWTKKNWVGWLVGWLVGWCRPGGGFFPDGTFLRLSTSSSRKRY